MKSILLALGFMAVFEGLMPMLAPGKWLEMLRVISQQPPEAVRKMAMAVCCLGLAFIWFVMEMIK
ncbi:MAG TPA: DUF2065 domain-containing protein [Sutterella sp.]|jgi:hypothetical protein|nr:DUF2065 domain-containing protein [Sutterella sp.]